MISTAGAPAVLAQAAPTGREEARARFPARPVPAAWPATRQSRGQVQDRLAREPFVTDNAHTEKIRRRGLTFLLDWLEDQPGATWQERWLASGADAAGTAWRKDPASWLHGQGLPAGWRLDALASALLAAISADVVRPALGWLVVKATGPGSLVRHLARSRDPEGFARLRALCDADPHVSAVSGSHTVYRAAELVAAKGGRLGDITVGDFLELLDTELDTRLPRCPVMSRCPTRCCTPRGSSAMTRRRRYERYAARASARLRNSSTATACNSVPSATFSWTTCANASRHWITQA